MDQLVQDAIDQKRRDQLLHRLRSGPMSLHAILRNIERDKSKRDALVESLVREGLIGLTVSVPERGGYPTVVVSLRNP